ncbi:hypothetical protein ACFQZM_11405 [Actinomadura fibrosa]|uniref:Lipoprotein n=2 Tax=Actinomadura fibrosa TaxID=111802 RepID=A0ABW2XKR9_9ACTN|nr:hypothetical protein [Actinomadura fibrosa]
MAALAIGALALSGCTSDGKAASSTSPSASKPPPAANGTNVAACAAGRCEVQVSASTKIPVPRDTRVDSVQIQSITADTVTVVGRVLGTRSEGLCTGRKCSSSVAGGRFTLQLGPDSTGTENGLSVTVVTITGKTAIIRFGPV